MKVTMSDVQEAKRWVKLITNPAVRELEQRIITFIEKLYGKDAITIFNRFTEIEFDENSKIIDEDGSLELDAIDEDGYIPIFIYQHKKLISGYVRLSDVLDKE